MKLFAIVDVLGENPASSNDVFLFRLDAEQELKKRDSSCDLVEIEIKKRDDLLLIRLENGPFKEPKLDFICACIDQVHNARKLCEVCGEWAGGPPEEEE
jgi:hypothetical protein